MERHSPLDLIRRGATEVISEVELAEKLAANRPLIVKAGFDPTAPDLHLGHTVLLRKLRHFQDLGHKVIFLIGDATALIGDPSGKSQTRPALMPSEVASNAKTYVEQVSKILHTRDAKVFELRRNSEWFEPIMDPIMDPAVHGEGVQFGFYQLVELLSRYTVARLMERDDFRQRLKAGQEVSMLELFYPLMQGYDSVKLKADVELGGTDQKFNLLVGRNLQRSYGQKPQVVITMPLLEGTDGVQKMSKSLGNHIGITEPPGEMFGKLMSIPDGLIVKYFTLLTDVDAARLKELERSVASRTVDTRNAKMALATTLVGMYHGEEAATQAQAEFIRVFSERKYPIHMQTIPIEPGPKQEVDLVELIVKFEFAESRNEARRLIKQGAVELDQEKVEKPVLLWSDIFSEGKKMVVLRVGSGNFVQLEPHQGDT